MTASHRFPRSARVRARSDFDRIFKHGRRVALPVLALHWLTPADAAAAAAAASPDARRQPPAEHARMPAPVQAMPADATPEASVPGCSAHDAGASAASTAPPEDDASDVDALIAFADGSRLGLAVSRKVDPRAVGRNRIKRILREFFRHRRRELAPADYVVVARPGAAALDAAQLTRALTSLLRRAGALPPAGATGTMPAAACEPGPAPPLH